MLPLPNFEYLRPESIDEAAERLGEAPGDTLLIAGGTDLVPNMKHGLFSPRRLLAIGGLTELREIEVEDDGGLRIGAGATLSTVAADPRIRNAYPSLARAAGLVAGPQLRNMGTLGGNLCLDTRCVYYNQTHFWREALGYCLKKEGDACRVVTQGRKCVAAFSADTPGPLITHGATVLLRSASDAREIPVDEFFHADGVSNTVRRPDELVVAVRLPAPDSRRRSWYEKLRVRDSIDFPILSIAVSGLVDPDETIRDLDIVVGALAARPKRLGGLEAIVQGRRLDEELIAEIGAVAKRQCRPLTNINVDPEWRREVVPAHLARALRGLVASRSFAA